MNPSSSPRSASASTLRRIAGSRALPFALMLATLLGAAFLSQSRADDLETVNFQGRLADDKGRPINGQRSVTFKIKEGTSVVWEQTKTVSFKNGFFSIVLGDGGVPLTDRISNPGVHVFSGDISQSYALSLTIDGSTFSDIAIKRVASSINSGLLNGKDDSYFNPMSSEGDLIYYDATASAPARLAIGSADQILTVSSGKPVWTSLGDVITGQILDANGQILHRNNSGEADGLAPGASNTLLKSTGTSTAPQWTSIEDLLKATVLQNNGDILIRDGSGNIVALSAPSAGEVLGENNGIPDWVDGGGVGNALMAERGIDIEYVNSDEIKLAPGGFDGKAVVHAKHYLNSDVIAIDVSSDLTVDLSATAGVGALDTGTEQDKQGYYVYLVASNDGSSRHLVCSTFSNQPHLSILTSYPRHSRPLFFIYNDTNKDIIEFRASGHNSSQCVYSPMLNLLTNGSSTTVATVNGSAFMPVDTESFTANVTFDNDSSSFNGGYLYDGDTRFVWFNVVFQATGRSAYVNWEGEIPIVNGTTNAIKYDWLSSSGVRKCTIRIRGWKRKVP